MPPAETIRQMMTGFWTAQAIHVAARLGLADHIAAGPKSSAELATLTQTHAPSLYRLLRMLASQGVFAVDEAQRFHLTPLAEQLRSDVPGSQRAAALMMGDEHYLSWAELLHCVQTGQTGFGKRFGKPIFDYLPEHPEAAAIFDAAMQSIHGAETAAMLDAYDFSGIGTLFDVGGGNGSLLVEVLQRYPQLRGAIYDLPHVVARTAQRLAQAGLQERCRTIGGSFFEQVPSGGDAYLLRHIIHDWDDDQSRTILRHCRRVMTPQTRLLLVESVITPGNEPSFAKLLDVNMLVLPGGMERTEAEYRTLYAAAGFHLTRIVPTRLEVCVIEGVPV